MKTPIRYVLLVAACGAFAHAAPQSDADLNALATVVQKADAGDLLGAATAAGARNTARKGSLRWYQQSGFELFRYAQILKGKQDEETLKRVAAAAAKILEAGLKTGGVGTTAVVRAQTNVQLATIYLELIGDDRKGRQCLQQALVDDPENEMALAMLARLQAEAEALQRFVNHKG